LNVLNIEMQSNLKFEKHITSKIKSASKILGWLLAYTSLCIAILEYGDTLWDPAENQTCDAIEHVQS